jgi:hypothetical protein
LIDAAPDPAAICAAIRAGKVTLRTEPVLLLELFDVFGGMTIRGRKPAKNAVRSRLWLQTLGFRLWALGFRPWGFGL